MIRSALVVCFFLFVFLFAKAQQKNTLDFSKLHIGIGYLPVLQFTPDDTLGYSPSNSQRLTFGTNYLKGDIKINLQFTNMIPLGQHPNCQMFDMSLSYAFRTPILTSTFILTGLQVGLNTIHFSGDEIQDDRDLETELSSGLEIGLEQQFKQTWALSCSYKLQRIFATPRNTFSLLDIGVTYYFNSKGSFRKWME